MLCCQMPSCQSHCNTVEYWPAGYPATGNCMGIRKTRTIQLSYSLRRRHLLGHDLGNSLFPARFQAAITASTPATSINHNHQSINHSCQNKHMVVETLGPVCSDGTEFITELGHRIASVSGDSRDTVISKNFSRGSGGMLQLYWFL